MQLIKLLSIQLRQEVYACKNGGPAIVDFNAFLKRLTEEGILDRIVSSDGNYYYRLSPNGKSTLTKIMNLDIEKYNHPPVSLPN